MVMYGADTDQLRQLAENYRSCASRMLEVSGSLTSTITSVTWEGPDAAAFQQQWNEVQARMRTVGDSITDSGAKLERNAEEQDIASSPGGAGLADALREGLRDLLGGIGGVIGSALDGIRDAGTANSEIGHGSASVIAPDEFDNQRGEDSSSDEIVLTLPDGTEVTVSEDADGTQTFSLNDPVSFEQKAKADGLEVSHKVEVGREVEVTVNPDGTLTYTFTGTSEQSVGAAGDGKYLGLEAGTSTTTESLYSVTVPPGTSFMDAVTINPFNPESIPPDGSVTVGAGVEQSSNLGLTGKYRGLEVGIGLDRTVGTDLNTVVSRDEYGNLSLLTGPTTMVRNDGTVSVGVEGAAFEMGNSYTREHGVLEYVQYSDDAAGNTAYTNTLWSDGYPQDTSVDGVIDRYTQTHTSTTMDSSFGVTIDDVLDVSRSHTGFADELIHRSYPDGREEWAQQVLPHGPDSNNSVYVHGGTGRETVYQMTLGDQPAGSDNSVGEAYWGGAHEGGDLVMSFSHDELSQMRENYAGWHGDPEHFSNETDYLASMTALASGNEAGHVMGQFITHYNYRPLEGTMWDFENPIYSEIRTPGHMN